MGVGEGGTWMCRLVVRNSTAASFFVELRLNECTKLSRNPRWRVYASMRLSPIRYCCVRADASAIWKKTIASKLNGS